MEEWTKFILALLWVGLGLLCIDYFPHGKSIEFYFQLWTMIFCFFAGCHFITR